MTDERHLVMIHKTNRRTLDDGCLAPDCGKSLTYCQAVADMERRRCCDSCQHP